ncbi:MAG: FCD domain-containing protein [Collinsella sp.]
MAAEHATNDQVACIKELCDESERLAEAGEDYSAADTAFHNAIAESSGTSSFPPDGRAQGIRPPLYRRDRQKARRGNYPHAPRCGRRHRLAQSHRRARRDVSAPVYNRNMIAEARRNRANKRPRGKGEITVYL